jgi:SET domain-containing protein
LIDPSLEFIRESESQTNDFYNFGNNNGTIDSRYMGNKARFINHGNDGDDNVSS